MLDALPATRLDARQQDVGHASDFAPTPSGCRHTRWYVVASKPNAERRAHAALHLKGYTPYLPLVTVRKPDRSYRIQPLFPGYLFVSLEPNKPWYTIRYAPGVFCLLTVEEKPAPCPPGVVEAIQAGEEARSIPTSKGCLWRPGAACEASLGGGQTVEGVVLSVRGQRAVIASIMFGHLREMVVRLDCLRLRDA